MTPWHVANPALLEALKAHVHEALPTFDVEVGAAVHVVGAMNIDDPSSGVRLDTWRIDLELPPSFPERAPLVRETELRIPWDSNRHVFSNGTVCLYVPEEEHRRWTHSIEIAEFVNGPVRAFFLGQTHFEARGEWPFGDRSHARGRLEFWFEELGTNDANAVRLCLQYLCKDWVKGHHPCYCGRMRKLRDCHSSKLVELRSFVDPSLAASSLRAIEEILQADNDDDAAGTAAV